MLKILRKPTVAELVDAQIDDAQRALMDALNGQEFANAMVAYQTARLNRLMGQRPVAVAPMPEPLPELPITMLEPEDANA